MSNYEENIRFLLINKPDITTKNSIYKSKYPGNIPPSYSTFGIPTRTTNQIANTAGKFDVKQRCFKGNTKNAMGPAKGKSTFQQINKQMIGYQSYCEVKKTINPKNFLKKGERLKISEEQVQQQLNKRSENKQ